MNPIDRIAPGDLLGHRGDPGPHPGVGRIQVDALDREPLALARLEPRERPAALDGRHPLGMRVQDVARVARARSGRPDQHAVDPGVHLETGVVGALQDLRQRVVVGRRPGAAERFRAGQDVGAVESVAPAHHLDQEPAGADRLGPLHDVIQLRGIDQGPSQHPEVIHAAPGPGRVGQDARAHRPGRVRGRRAAAGRVAEHPRAGRVRERGGVREGDGVGRGSRARSRFRGARRPEEHHQ